MWPTKLCSKQGVDLPDKDEVIGKILAIIGTTFKKVITTCLETTPEDKLVVVNHGDCWNNNMLFKVTNSDGQRSVKEHMFVDLQVKNWIIILVKGFLFNNADFLAGHKINISLYGH